MEKGPGRQIIIFFPHFISLLPKYNNDKYNDKYEDVDRELDNSKEITVHVPHRITVHN